MSAKSTLPPIDITGITPVEQWFHEEKIPVYPTVIAFEQISYWPENFRTALDFDLLAQEKKKPLSELTVDEITDYLAQRKLKLADLSASIKRNGVRVPIIVLLDGTLLDGNRRFFACAYLKKRAAEKKQPRSPVLDRIPVWVIKMEDIDARRKIKILAEMNFVADLKMDWPDSVKARCVAELYERCRNEKKSDPQAFKEIDDLYGVDTATAKAYIETVQLTTQFITSGRVKQRDKHREIVQRKFVYFWEFRNKGMWGGGALDAKKDLPEVRRLFFKMMSNSRLDNLKQIEPVIWAKSHAYEWKLLVSSGGSKINQVEALFKEEKAIKSAEEKIKGFHRWVQKLDPTQLTKAVRDLLKDVAKLCQKAANK